VDFFGEQLVRAGYNYYGNEVMYSGVSGTEMKCEIFFGVRTTILVLTTWPRQRGESVSMLTRRYRPS